MAGGGSANALWNRIRATVLDRPIEVLDIAEVSLIGTLRHVMCVTDVDDSSLRALLHGTRVEPEPAWRDAYEAGYRRFLRVQAALDPGALAAEAAASPRLAAAERSVHA
jgi:sugar (pentulose or hexulose) kinase